MDVFACFLIHVAVLMLVVSPKARSVSGSQEVVGSAWETLGGLAHLDPQGKTCGFTQTRALTLLDSLVARLNWHQSQQLEGREEQH